MAMLLAFTTGLTAILCLPGPAVAQDFYVTTAAELQTALDTADNNGQDDVIYLAAGTYQGTFEYLPQDAQDLTIQGEDGTTAQNVILDGGAGGTTLRLGGEGAIGGNAASFLTSF